MTRASPLPAKVARPILKGVAPRTRLFARLDEWRGRRGVWVCGPAGCGKTTLVASYLATRGGPVLWYQVDDGDRDPATFFYYLGMAAKTAAPRHRKPLPLLTPEYLPGLATFTRRYFETLAGRLKVPAALVLDNLHEAGTGPDFYELLREGLSRLPAGLTVYLLSRHVPPPAFARLVANQDIAVLGWEELRLTAEESAEIIRMGSAEAPPHEDLLRLHGAANGWVAGLLLVLEWVRRERVEPKALARASSREILDYFGSEVLDRTDAATQEFLLKTAVMPRMTARMAEALTGLPLAGALLARLSGENCFTERRFDIQPVYQYHSLFREFLLARGRERFGPEELSALRRRAAALLEEGGETDEAAVLLGEASDWEGLTALILKHAPVLLAHGRHRALQGWLDRLPAEVLAGTPWLLYWRGACLMPHDPAAARPFFERAQEGCQEQGDAAGTFLSWAGTVEATCLAYEDFKPLDRWIATLDQLMRRLGPFPSPEIETRVATAMVTALVWRQPRRPDIETWASRALSRRTPDAFVSNLQTIWMVMRRDYFAGDPRKVARARQQILEMGRSQDCPPLVHIMVNISEARYFDQAGQHEECMSAASQGLEIARREGIHVLDSELLANAIIGALNANDWKRARGWLDEMWSSRSVRTPLSAALYHWLKAREALIRRDSREALQHSDLVLRDIRIVPASFRGHAFLVRARALHALGRDAEVAESLAQAQREVERLGSPLVEFLILMAEAEFSLMRGREAESLATLRKALRIGKAGGYLGIEVDVPAVTARLCAQALTAGIEVEYVREIIRKRRLRLDDPPYQVDGWPWPLTVHTLGGFRLERDGQPVSFPGKVKRKPLLLLKALVALGGKGVREEQVSDLLWPDAEGDAAHSALTTTLARLRELLGVEHAIRVQDGQVSLDPCACWVDAWAFERLLGEVEARLAELRKEQRRERPDQRARRALADLVGKAAGLYRGHFLAEDAAEVWTASCRERLRTKFLRLIVRWGEHLEGAEQWKDAVACYQRGLEVDELAEEFYQRLMVCYQRIGLRAEAIATYRRCREVLATGLGVAPSARTDAIHRSLRD